jgi:hypothetical protein
MTRRTGADATRRNHRSRDDVLVIVTITGVLRPTAALLLVLALAACADPASPRASSPDPSAPATTLPDGADTLVLRIEDTGGFVPAGALTARVPRVSVYADGRMVTDGPVALMYPGPALPNVLVARLGADQVRQVVDRALAAGVAETADLGTPPIADATTTRFTLTTAEATYVREVYALERVPSPGSGHDDGLTGQQSAGREALAGLVSALEDLDQQQFAAGTPPQTYTPSALAVVGRPWVDPGDGLPQPTLDWPGPPLPGGCVVVTGDQVPVVLAAARSGNSATSWRTADGGLWSVQFRPLLPDESTCADLTD